MKKTDNDSAADFDDSEANNPSQPDLSGQQEDTLPASQEKDVVSRERAVVDYGEHAKPGEALIHVAI